MFCKLAKARVVGGHKFATLTSGIVRYSPAARVRYSLRSRHLLAYARGNNVSEASDGET